MGNTMRANPDPKLGSLEGLEGLGRPEEEIVLVVDGYPWVRLAGRDMRAADKQVMHFARDIGGRLEVWQLCEHGAVLAERIVVPEVGPTTKRRVA